MIERLTVAEVAERLRVSPYTVRRMVRDGELAAVKIGRQILIKADEVERVLEEGTRPIPLAGGRMFPRNSEPVPERQEATPSEASSSDPSGRR